MTQTTELQPQANIDENTGTSLVLERLTERHRRFVLGLYGGLNTVAAARAAGIGSPEVHAYEIRKRPEILLALNELRQKDIDMAGITRKDVIAGLMDAVQAAANATELTMAWKEIGKLLGLYEPEVVKHEHAHKHDVGEKTLLQMQQMDTNELLRIAGQSTIAPVDVIEGEFEEVDDSSEEVKDDQPQG
jgi:phage terminase small subunit